MENMLCTKIFVFHNNDQRNEFALFANFLYRDAALNNHRVMMCHI